MIFDPTSHNKVAQARFNVFWNEFKILLEKESH